MNRAFARGWLELSKFPVKGVKVTTEMHAPLLADWEG